MQDAVAKGEYQIAFGPYLSDMRNPGLDVVGALPPEASTPVDITGFLSTERERSRSGVERCRRSPLVTSGCAGL